LSPDLKFTKVQAPNAPLLVDQSGMALPGGADVNLHGNKIAWHYQESGSCANGPLIRTMKTGNLNTDGINPSSSSNSLTLIISTGGFVHFA
jgi:hypothetical protein